MDARRGHQAARFPAARSRLRLLGAIIAGGRSRRFGSDKALALLDGRPLIEHVADGLQPQVESLVVAGRDYPGLASVADYPGPGLGPLGGLCGALLHAEAQDYAAVLSAPCDSVPVPDLSRLPVTGGVLERWPLHGLWPVSLARTLAHRLKHDADRSVFGWVAAAGLPEFPAPSAMINITRPADLAVRPEVIGDRGANP